VGLLPDQAMHKHPVLVIGALAGDGFREIGDFQPHVAIAIHHLRADRLPIVVRGAGSLAFFELRLAHAAHGPSRTAQAFIRRDAAFREAMSFP
jgi:hypothetical protein